MSSAALAVNSRVNVFVMPSGGALSKESDFLFDGIEDIRADLNRSIFFGLYREEIGESLIEAFNECSAADWDGYGASAASSNSLFEALDFTAKLSSDFPRPEVYIEPSGELGLEWHTKRRSTFLISFDGHDTISYAGVFGSNTVHGSEYFGEVIPDVVIESIRRLDS